MKKNDESGRNKGTESKPDGEAIVDSIMQLPADFEAKVRQLFEKVKQAEISFEQHLEHEKNKFHRLAALERNPALIYQRAAATMTPCGNGDLEQSLDPAEWQGAYGSLPLNAVNPFSSFTAGILGGPIGNANSHQTWVAAGTDPNVGIPTTAQGSAGAVRIGNNIPGCGCELLSKTFVVTPTSSTIIFWYAVVMQNPLGHDTTIQPFFWVRVTDAAGNIVPGAFDFGNGSDKLSADKTNPFFQTIVVGQEPIVYKDWSCAQIDLTTQIGNQVTVEFVTADCGACGHWGYAYIDSFCGDCKGSPTGDISYNCEASTHCGDGKVCFDYSLPTVKDPKGNITTGSVTITLDIYQNGVLLTQLTSPTLTGGSSYCFNVVPGSIPGINAALGGFDLTATGAFAMGGLNLGHIKVGSAPDGIEPGQNNDYQIACKTCAEIEQEQNKFLSKQCGHKVNLLPRISCRCPNSPRDKGDCHCDCVAVTLPEIKPCISVAWGDSRCDCMETDDVEVLCITVCNCYSNVTFNDLTIGQIRITDMAGNPVPVLPDGTPSVRVIPSGPICFGDIGPCKGKNKPDCVSRELVLYTRGAVGQEYRLSFEGVCFNVSHEFQSEECFVVTLCQD
ncbi:MAG: hypothetical protein QOE77_1641 [Blastocatellia bacterium]|jgi:hypothetical protein|nr:hypothetical protein [Blastocatellia bacterium]